MSFYREEWRGGGEILLLRFDCEHLINVKNGCYGSRTADQIS